MVYIIEAVRSVRRPLLGRIGGDFLKPVRTHARFRLVFFLSAVTSYGFFVTRGPVGRITVYKRAGSDAPSRLIEP